jgi:glycine cleavage system aminomethyltransferase T
VTSSCRSPKLERSIGLALVDRDLPVGSELIARDPLRNLETAVKITTPVHYDPAGTRMKGR